MLHVMLKLACARFGQAVKHLLQYQPRENNSSEMRKALPGCVGLPEASVDAAGVRVVHNKGKLVR